MVDCEVLLNRLYLMMMTVRVECVDGVRRRAVLIWFLSPFNCVSAIVDYRIRRNEFRKFVKKLKKKIRINSALRPQLCTPPCPICPFDGLRDLFSDLFPLSPRPEKFPVQGQEFQNFEFFVFPFLFSPQPKKNKHFPPFF